MTDTTNDTFRIDRLTLKSFRCFEERTIDFHPRFNVLIGDNGSGKTTVCDALAYALSSMQWVFDLGPVTSQGQVRFASRDVRLVTVRGDGLPRLEKQYPAGVRCDGVAASEPASWGRFVPERGREEHPFLGQPFGDTLLGLRALAVWPLIARYGANRFAGDPTATAGDPMPNAPRHYAYAACLDARPSEVPFLQWMKRIQFVADQEQLPMPSAEAAKRAVEQSVGDCRGMMYRAYEDRLTVDLVNGETLPLDALSDGIRSMIAMVADMAWRAASLNAHLAEDAVCDTPGVVVIDELDLHLHPTWQRHVVGDLKRAFPKVQFIATTHSPFIIQSLEPGELIKLDAESDEELARANASVGKSLEDIAESAMDVEVPSRSERFQAMVRTAEEYFRLLHEGGKAPPEELAQAKARLDELSERFSDDPAWVALLRAEREAAGLGEKVQ